MTDTHVDPITFPVVRGEHVREGDPGNLAEQLSAAEGWSFRITTPTEDLTIKGSTDSPVNMVGDDLHQYYTRFGSATK